MPTTLPKNDRSGQRLARRGASNERTSLERTAIAASLIGALMLAIVTGTVPTLLVMPAFGIALVLTGSAIGVHALMAGRALGRSRQPGIDVAGILVLFGFAAAMLSDKAEAMQLLCEIMGTQPAARNG